MTLKLYLFTVHPTVSQLQALTKLEDYGFIQSKAKGEYHANNQTMAKLLHKAIGLGDPESKADPELYSAYQV